MDFTLTDDRRMLQELVARFVREQYPFETRDAVAKSGDGFSREMWGQFAELGLIGALLPEAVGGFGGRGFDIMVVFQELGRGIVVEPFLATAVLGASAIAIAGSEAQKSSLEEVIGGGRLLALAHGEPESRYSQSEVRTTAVSEGDGWSITGRKAVVFNGDSAETLIVSARVAGADDAEDGLALFLVDAMADGVSRRGYPTIDGGRAAEIAFNGVTVGPDMALGEPGAAFPVIEETIGRGVLALCAEAVGAMEAARDLTVEYLQTRTQFGQPLGKFQALQHRMAEVLTEIEQARSAVIIAAGRLEEPRLARETALSAAKNLIGRVGRLVAEESIQMHGGIGMTWEYSLPHFAKRLIMIDHQLGDTDHHLERFIALRADAA